jgi:2-dehydropantoate 2-reductase
VRAETPGARVARHVGPPAASLLDAVTSTRTSPEITPAPVAAQGAVPPARSKRTLVVGAGAVGSFLGALLGSVGHEVTLVRIFEPDSERPVELIRPDGRRTSIPVHRITHTVDATEPDLILVAVKMPMLRQALEPTLRWSRTPTLTVENGIGAYEIATEMRPHAPHIAGSLTAPIVPASEDEVRWLGRGGMGLAAVNSPAEPLVADLVADLNRSGFRTARLASAPAMKWSKLLANLIANASGAILDMEAAAIYADPRLFDVERRQLLETLGVMSALGLRPVAIPGAAIPWLARGARLPAWIGRPILSRALGDARSGKMPSLRIHVRSAPPDGPSPEQTEVEWMNGAVAAHGVRLGVETPVNTVLAALTDQVAVDPERRTWFRGHPERLLEELRRADNRS